MNKKMTSEFYSEIDHIIDTETFVESVKTEFADIDDPRVKDNQSYPLISLLVMILAAIIAGANAITHIHDYAVLKQDMFRRLLGIDRAPSYQVFWWLLVRLNPKELQQTFSRWINELPNDVKDRIIAIDGKRLNGTSKQLVHLVSAWDAGRGLVLGQVRTDVKSNEITAIPELLKTIDVRDAVVTIDAAGCQKKIVEEIRNRGGNYVIALKGNQGNLYAEAQNFFDQASDANYEYTGCSVSKTIEKGHGRIEEREVVVTGNLDWLECREEWKDLKTLIEVTARRKDNDKWSEEKRYYISNLQRTPEQFGGFVRGHWGIENHLNWCMDVIFKEDECVVSVGHAPENLAIFRRIAQSLIKIDLGSSVGVAKKRRQAGWDDTYVIRLLGALVNGKSF